MLAKKLQSALAGGGGDKLYVEDVFSTYLYNGTDTSTSHQIQNGIDLAGEGGLVWIKKRDSNIANTNHYLSDTERGNYYLASNSTNAQAAGDIASYNSDGWTFNASTGLGTDYLAAQSYVSWTFRKAEKFFDVVTYTGNGSATQTINHNLGSSPGCIIIKAYSSVSSNANWIVWHRSLPTSAGYLNTTDAFGGGEYSFNLGAPTSTTFTVVKESGFNSATNDSGISYVAYLFAHDAGGFGDDGEQNVISCGSFNSGTSATEVNVGFEPQWLMFKRTDGTQDWMMFDNMRGFGAISGTSARLRPNLSDAEDVYTPAQYVTVTSNGFIPNPAHLGGSRNFIYIAIRRPMKTPESGTEVFAPNYVDNGASSPDSISGFPVDMYFRRYVNTTNDTYLLTRLTSPNALKTNGTDAEAAFSSSSAGFDYQNGVMNIFSADNSDFHTWMFRRAPGFFDVVCYTGTGSARTVSHNLAAVPELMIVKIRSGATYGWYVYDAINGAGYRLRLDDNGETNSDTSVWNNTAPTSSVFSLGNAAYTNGSGYTFVAYLFASLDGISKIGSYTGNGSSQTINCGFSSGARFILIKRSDATNDWFVFDSVRGIVSGNEPYLMLNVTSAETTTTDSVDPSSGGFIVNQNSTSNLNVNSATYIYLAIA